MPRPDILPIHEIANTDDTLTVRTVETEAPSSRWRRLACAAGTLAVASTILLGSQATPPETAVTTDAPVSLAALTYKIGGTGDPHAGLLPRAATRYNPHIALHYPAATIDMPGSIQQGANAIVRATNNDGPATTATVVGFSQGAFAAHNAAASGRIRGKQPRFVFVSDPAHPSVPGHGGRGIANYATQYGLPALQARSYRNYKGEIVSICNQGDPICDYDPRLPLGSTALNYWNIHLGNGPFNYNTANPRRAKIKKIGNRTYIYNLNPGVRRQASAPAPGARIPAVASVATPKTAAAPRVTYNTPHSAPRVVFPEKAAPTPQQAPVQTAVRQVADEAVKLAPAATPHIRQAERDVSTHYKNLRKLIPGLPG